MKKSVLQLMLLASVITISSSFVHAGSFFTVQDFFSSYFAASFEGQTFPSTVQSIPLLYKNITPDMKLYAQLQKAVYVNLLPNAKISLPLTGYMTQQQAINIIHLSMPESKIDYTAKKFVTQDWLKNTLLQIKANQEGIPYVEITPVTDATQPTQQEIYQKLKSDYIDPNKLDADIAITGTVGGIVNGLKDQYTHFFSPEEAKSFSQDLQGEYEGIGAYLDMKVPGIILISGTMPGAPAEKAGLLSGDVILSISGNVITQQTDASKVASRIKGPAKTTVRMIIQRGNKIIPISLKREKIKIPSIDNKIYTKTGSLDKTCLISLHMFPVGGANEFTSIMDKDQKEKCTKYIFDLRNNPGGSLDDVSDMLKYIVPTGQPTVVIKTKSATEKMIAADAKKITNLPILLLMNGFSASASEIFAGTIRDYGKNVTIVGEQSYGKGSVQEIANYADGSMLKYTIATRYTGKTQKTIDHVGITPDVKMSDDITTPNDEVLDRALSK